MRDALSSPALSALPMRSSKSRSKSKNKNSGKGALAVAAAALALSLAGCAVLPGGGSAVATGERPEGFVALQSVAPGIVQDLRNQGSHNVLGRPLAGYEAPVCLLTAPAAQALQAVQAGVQRHGLALKVLDCYRPQAADALAHSSHSRGSAVDLTLVVTDAQRAAQLLQGPLAQGEVVDMGTTPPGLVDADAPPQEGAPQAVSPDVKHNRAWLRGQMQQHGLVPEDSGSGRWWHFKLQDEPYPKQSFSFPVR